MATSAWVMWQNLDGCPGYWAINSDNPPCEITIEARPDYCDRGNWIAKLHPEGYLSQEIDLSDLWPRYYFDLERAKQECEAWLEKRAKPS